MAEVILAQVSKIYSSGIPAVRDLNLHVADSELLVLVGPSGSGKTTTLRLIAGLERPSSGTIAIGGRFVHELPPHHRDVAVVCQRSLLYPHMSIRRNLAFGLELQQSGSGLFRCRNKTAELEKRVVEVARLLQMEELLERKPYQLSGGQQQRVALGRALVRRPAVFLLDEPLSHLDARLRAEMRRELHLLHKRFPATMIYVTHDPLEAMTLGDRVVVLDGGVVQQVDRPQVVYDRPANRCVAGFFGWPPMNLIDGMLAESAGRCYFRTVDGTATLPLPQGGGKAGQVATLGIRPENVGLLTVRHTIEVDGCRQEPILDMEIILLEPLGGSCLMHLQRGGLRLTAVMEAGRMWHEGQKVSVVLHMDRTHLFDGVSGQPLCRAGRSG